MADGKFIGLGGVGLLAVLCSAGPFLLVAIGSFGLSAWLAAIGYVIIPIAIATVGVTGLYLYRRRHSASSDRGDCCSIAEKNKDELNV